MLGWQDAELWLAGRVDLPVPLLAQYRNMSGVRFLGHVSSIQDVFQQADVFVFPSLAEGSALVTYEAMASGLPVVVTFNAGSVARDGEDGFIIPARNPKAIAESLERLRADDRLRKKMGEAARERVDMFTWKRYGDRVAEELRHVYDLQTLQTTKSTSLD
jgi:glycosyltransferase involved in cell wall biosynthesis